MGALWLWWTVYAALLLLAGTAPARRWAASTPRRMHIQLAVALLLGGGAVWALGSHYYPGLHRLDLLGRGVLMAGISLMVELAVSGRAPLSPNALQSLVLWVSMFGAPAFPEIATNCWWLIASIAPLYFLGRSWLYRRDPRLEQERSAALALLGLWGFVEIQLLGLPGGFFSPSVLLSLFLAMATIWLSFALMRRAAQGVQGA